MDKKPKTKKPKAKKPKAQKQKQKQKQSVKVVVNVGKGETETAPIRRHTNEIQMYAPPLNIYTQPNLQNQFRQLESNQPVYQMPTLTRQTNMQGLEQFYPEDITTYYTRYDNPIYNNRYDKNSVMSSQPNTEEEIVNELTDDRLQINAGIIDRYNEATGKTDYIQTQTPTLNMTMYNPMPNNQIEDLSSERQNDFVPLEQQNTQIMDIIQQEEPNNKISDITQQEEPNTQITDITQQEEPNNTITQVLKKKSNNPLGRPKKGEEKVVEEYPIPLPNPTTGLLPLTNKTLKHLQNIAEHYNIKPLDGDGTAKKKDVLMIEIQKKHDADRNILFRRY